MINLKTINIKLFLFILFVIVSAILFASCDTQISASSSKKLDRAKAKDIIIRHHQFPCEHYTMIYVAADLAGTVIQDPINTIDVSKMIKNKLIWFREYDHEFMMNTDIYRYCKSISKEPERVELGAFVNPKFHILEVKLYEQKFIEVTGIKFTNERTATVKYKINNINPTPVANYIKTVPNGLGKYDYPLGEVEVEDNMALYDDGWRVEN